MRNTSNASVRFTSLGNIFIIIVMLFSAVGYNVSSAEAAPAGTALQFNGSTQYATLGTATQLRSATFTVELWFKRTGVGVGTGTGSGGIASAIPLITKGRADGETAAQDVNYYFGIDATSGRLVADFEEAQVAQGGTTPGLNHPITGTAVIAADSTWHHAAATYDGTTWNLYLDGVLDGTLSVGRPANALTNTLTSVGSARTTAGVAAGFFAGAVDEVRIWNVARSLAQINTTRTIEITSAQANLLGVWNLNEGTGISLGDSSGNGITGATVGGQTWVAGFPLPDFDPPAAPTGLAASALGQSVNLTWTANSEPDLAGYNVYRSTSPSVPLTGPINGGTLVTGASYGDGGRSYGTQYYYVVTAVDTSTNQSTASNEVSATPLASNGSALQFDGTNDYVTFGSTAGLGVTSFTIETWFKRTGTGTGTSTGSGGITSAIPLVTKGRAESEGTNVDMNYFLGLDTTTNRLVADFEEGAGGPGPLGLNHPITGTTAISVDNVWHHTAVTYDATTREYKLYLDGNLEVTQTLAAGVVPRSDSIQHAGIGTAMTSAGLAAGFFAGVLDESRVWNVARTQVDINTDKNSELTSGTGLVARWGINEGSGITINSSVGSFPGTVTNGPIWVAGFVPPPPGNLPPNAPTVNAPLNGATGVGTSPTLDVGVSDPESSPLTVTFFGRPIASGVFAQIAQNTGVTSGSSTTAPWTSLDSGQQYEWFVTVNDGSATTTGPTWNFRTAAGTDPVFVGAGDIADCGRPQDTTTAAIIQGVDGTVWTTGDNVYPTGAAAYFTNCYDPTWGLFKSRTRPIPGNHDWGTGDFNNLTDYHAYFGANATDAGGKSYYSYDIAGSNWHIVNLDSECALVTGGCTDGSAQENWLQADLAANMSKNVIALFHKPRYSSSSTNLVDLQPFVNDLYAAGADLILVGHDHVYERFLPIDADGALDPTYGIRHFTVGTGGASLFTSFGTTKTGSEVRHLSTYGIMKLTLHASSYDWKFMPVAGSTFTDSGTQAVHAAPPVVGQTTIPISDTTGEKPQSKVWENAGTWWSVMPSTTVAPVGTWLWRLEPDDTWTNVLHLSNSTDTQADAKVVGNVTHLLLHGASSQLVSIQYVAVGNTYEPWSSRPLASAVSLPNSETATIDIDSLGRMWLATENVANLNVYYSDSPYSTFTGPITLANNIHDDDIGVVTALPNNTIGVLWSNQTTQRFGFRVHQDGANPITWSADEVPASGSALPQGAGMADDHLNVAVASDGTLYAAVKTSYDTAGFTKIALLVRRPNGTWDPLYEVDQSGTRGIVLLNEQDNTVRVVYTSSEGFNDILVKKSSTSPISFGPATNLMTGGLNDATSQKANWTDEVLVLASSASQARGAFLTADAVPLVGWWQMENNAQDSSTYANHGSLIGSPTFVLGRIGQAISLTGTQNISVPDDNSLDLTTAMTVAAWIRPTGAAAATQDLVKKATLGSVNGYELSLSSAGKVFIRLNQLATPTDVYRINSVTNYPLNNSAWMHVAATYDGTTIKLYINGVQEGGNLAGPAAIVTNSLALGLGAQSDNTRRFAGLLDDVRIEARALSAAEIAALAAAGANNAPNTPTVNAPLNGATGVGTSPTLDVGVSDPNSSDLLTVTFFGRPYASGVFTQIGQNTGVASGSNTTKLWASLGAGQRFEWYATVSDGIATTIGPTWTFNTTPSTDPVFVGSGDIASCAAAVVEDIATGELISGVQGTIFTTGDNVYPNGTAAEFANCYETTPWGSTPVQSRTRPVPGNHDWGTGVTNSLSGYFGYYGANATDAGGNSYYSYDIAGSNWHIVNLDSECQLVPGGVPTGQGCAVGSAQETWLKADLAANMSKNVIAVWHKPRYSSGSTDDQAMQPLWDALYAAGVDILLDGHDHIYERTAPMKSGATLASPPVADPLYGIRQFTVGTGGEAHHDLGTLLPTSESSNDETFGIFKLTLHATTYDWVFLPIAGSTFTDSGTGSVHGAPPVPNQAPNAPTLNAPADGSSGIGTSPTLSVGVSDPNSSDLLTVTFFGRPYASGVFTQIGQNTGVASGSNTTKLWASLGAGQRFEWYVAVNDGNTTTTGPTWTFNTTPSVDPVFVGSGDIASCAVAVVEDIATGELISGVQGTIFTTGDNVYPNGTAAEFANCYETTPWGSTPVQSRTRPVPGNHDWGTGVTNNLNGYFGYYGANANAGGTSYYSYDIAGSNWHIVNLDSECQLVPGGVPTGQGCAVGSAQETWLKADLAANMSKNVIAVWHKPRYSSGSTDDQAMQPLWDALYAAGVDILLDGHDHIYERTAPMKSGATLASPPVADPLYGIRQFTVGTGGEAHHGLGTLLPTSESSNDETFGIFKLTLHATTYDWVFLPIAGSTFTDSGTGSVHGAPPVCYTLTLSHTGQGSDPVASPANSTGCGAGTYLSGESISLSGAAPSGGWQISSWTGTTNNSSTSSTNTVSMPASAHTASVNYTVIPPTCYALTLSHTGQGSNPVASPANSTGCGAGTYVSGASISLSGAVPTSGWQISSWTGTNNNTSTASTNTVTMPASAHTASVNYTAICYALTLSHTGQGSNPIASPANSTGCGAGTYVSGASISLSGAVPTSGWQISSWTGTNNNSSTTSTNTVTMPASAHTASVNYTAICYALTLSHTGQGSNPVASPANSAGCSPGQYLSGASISLSGAVPTSGWQISSWTGTNNNTSTASTNTVTMPASAHTASVNYTAICYALTLSHTGQGSNPVASPANSTGCGAGTYVSGTSISLSGAVPTSGWQISSWTGTTNNSSTASTNTVTMPASAHTTSVNYTQSTYTLNVTAVGSGTVVKNPDQATYLSGTSVQLTATPASGWTFSSWSGDASGTANPISILMDGNKSVTANFTSVGANIIFADGFESGNLAAWTSSTIDSGDLSVSTTAALVGTRGMQALLDDNKSIYVTDDSPNAEMNYLASFRFDPNSITMASGDAHFIFNGFTGTSTAVLRLEFQRSSTNYQVRARLLNDASAWTNTNWFTISDAPHTIELEWHASTAPGANNGSLRLLIDGVQQVNLTGVDNDTRRIDRARLGAVAGVDTGTRGTYYFDEFVSQRQGGGPPPTATLTVNKTGTGSGTVTSNPAGINCGSTCSSSFNTNTVVTLTASAASGSTFTGWSGAGCSGTGTCTVTMTANTSVTANFNLQSASPTLTVNKTGTGSGTVTSNPAGISCGSTCSSSFNTNTVVTLTASAASGSTFTGWSGAGCSGTGTCTVTMTTSTSVTANFNLQSASPTLTVSKTGTGSGTVTSNPAGINCGSTCSSSFNTNTVVTLTASAASGSTFTGWSGAGCSGTGTCTVTMTANTSVTANFTLTSPTDVIFADSFESGSLSAWTSSNIDAGDLSVSAAAAMAGSSPGMQALVDDNTAIYVNDDSPNAEPRYRARFYFDPNSIPMASGDGHLIFKGFAGASTEVLKVEFRKSGVDYQIRASIANDASSFTNSSFFTISDGPHSIEIDWRASTAPGANNGGLTLWIDNVQQVDLTGVDNDTWRVNSARLGALSSIDNGTRGTYFFDAFVSRRQTYIGP